MVTACSGPVASLSCAGAPSRSCSRADEPIEKVPAGVVTISGQSGQSRKLFGCAWAWAVAAQTRRNVKNNRIMTSPSCSTVCREEDLLQLAGPEDRAQLAKRHVGQQDQKQDQALGEITGKGVPLHLGDAGGNRMTVDQPLDELLQQRQEDQQGP